MHGPRAACVAVTAGPRNLVMLSFSGSEKKSFACANALQHVGRAVKSAGHDSTHQSNGKL